jgi:hypothetical protein
MMIPRRPPHQRYGVSVAKACAEQGFYEIAAGDLEESHRAGHDPEAVEKVLASIEGTVSRIMADVLRDGFPLPEERRFKLALFTSLQVTRGWRFRSEMNELGTFAMRQYLETLSADYFRDWLRGRGEASDADAVAAFRGRVLGPGGPRLVMGQAFAVQESLRMAVEQVMGHLYFRSWRLLRFPDDLLLISDSPVGMWTQVPSSADCPSGQDFAVGVANASIVCMPLNRRTALAMTMHKGPDKVIDSGPVRARQINMALVHDAQRWIYDHPDDRPLDGIDIPEPAVFTDEIVAVRDDADGTRHEFHRAIRRPPRAPANRRPGETVETPGLCLDG